MLWYREFEFGCDEGDVGLLLLNMAVIAPSSFVAAGFFRRPVYVTGAGFQCFS